MKIFYKGKPITPYGKGAKMESKAIVNNNKRLIARYKFNSSIDTLFSEVNEGFVYTHTDIDNGDGTITRTIYSDQLPTIIRFEDCEGLLEVNYLNTSELTTLRKTFKNCYNVTSINATDWDTSNVTSLYEAFEDCNNLTTLDVSNWNTGNVTDMRYTFWKCYSLTELNLSNWDTGNVTTMKAIFLECYLLTTVGDLSNWDVGNVTDMCGMFWSCESLISLDLSNWNVGNATTMEGMFAYCYYLESVGDLSNWQVGNVTNMKGMFYCCESLTSIGDLSNWQVSNVTNMELLFCNCCSFTQDTVNGLRNWDVSNVENMYAMIDCLCLNGVTTIDLSGWDVSNVTTMKAMLEYNSELKYLNLNNWILNENVDTTELLKKSDNLEKVSIMNSNTFTINKIIAELPTRTTDSMGTLDITGIDDISQVNVGSAESKFWNVVNE